MTVCALVLCAPRLLLLLNNSTAPIIEALGDASYSIYLTHGFVIPIAGKLWGAAHLWSQPVLLLCLSTLASCVAGVAC
ncbi:acyltransferase family protein [Methylobacterium thuringiense]|uniref:acyltransferase family protein n=1 Tax=Methylobacterium thuringiense TaxID=1003091 RepID=UPI00357107C8